MEISSIRLDICASNSSKSAWSPARLSNRASTCPRVTISPSSTSSSEIRGEMALLALGPSNRRKSPSGSSCPRAATASTDCETVSLGAASGGVSAGRGLQATAAIATPKIRIARDGIEITRDEEDCRTAVIRYIDRPNPRRKPSPAPVGFCRCVSAGGNSSADPHIWRS